MARNSVLQSGFDEETKAPCFERSGESLYMIAVSIQQVKFSSCPFGFLEMILECSRKLGGLN